MTPLSLGEDERAYIDVFHSSSESSHGEVASDAPLFARLSGLPSGEDDVCLGSILREYNLACRSAKSYQTSLSRLRFAANVCSRHVWPLVYHPCYVDRSSESVHPVECPAPRLSTGLQESWKPLRTSNSALDNSLSGVGAFIAPSSLRNLNYFSLKKGGDSGHLCGVSLSFSPKMFSFCEISARPETPLYKSQGDTTPSFQKSKNEKPCHFTNYNFFVPDVLYNFIRLIYPVYGINCLQTSFSNNSIMQQRIFGRVELLSTPAVKRLFSDSVSTEKRTELPFSMLLYQSPLPAFRAVFFGLREPLYFDKEAPRKGLWALRHSWVLQGLCDILSGTGALRLDIPLMRRGYLCSLAIESVTHKSISVGSFSPKESGPLESIRDSATILNTSLKSAEKRTNNFQNGSESSAIDSSWSIQSKRMIEGRLVDYLGYFRERSFVWQFRPLGFCESRKCTILPDPRCSIVAGIRHVKSLIDPRQSPSTSQVMCSELERQGSRDILQPLLQYRFSTHGSLFSFAKDDISTSQPRFTQKRPINQKIMNGRNDTSGSRKINTQNDNNTSFSALMAVDVLQMQSSVAASVHLNEVAPVRLFRTFFLALRNCQFWPFVSCPSEVDQETIVTLSRSQKQLYQDPLFSIKIRLAAAAKFGNGLAFSLPCDTFSPGINGALQTYAQALPLPEVCVRNLLPCREALMRPCGECDSPRDVSFERTSDVADARVLVSNEQVSHPLRLGLLSKCSYYVLFGAEVTRHLWNRLRVSLFMDTALSSADITKQKCFLDALTLTWGVKLHLRDVVQPTSPPSAVYYRGWGETGCAVPLSAFSGLPHHIGVTAGALQSRLARTLTTGTSAFLMGLPGSLVCSWAWIGPRRTKGADGTVSSPQTAIVTGSKLLASRIGIEWELN